MKSKSNIIAVLAIAAVVASLPAPGESSPLLKKPVMEFPAEIETYGPVDVMVSKKLQGPATGDDIYVNIPAQQTIRH